MSLRYSSKNAAVALAGTAFTHGIAVKGVATTPAEWAVNHRGAPPAGSPPAYVVSAGSTSLVVAASSGATTCDIFAFYNHSLIE